MHLFRDGGNTYGYAVWTVARCGAAFGSVGWMCLPRHVRYVGLNLNAAVCYCIYTRRARLGTPIPAGIPVQSAGGEAPVRLLPRRSPVPIWNHREPEKARGFWTLSASIDGEKKKLLRTRLFLSPSPRHSLGPRPPVSPRLGKHGG